MNLCHGQITVTCHGRDRSQKRCALSRLLKKRRDTELHSPPYFGDSMSWAPWHKKLKGNMDIKDHIENMKAREREQQSLIATAQVKYETILHERMSLENFIDKSTKEEKCPSKNQ